MTDSGFDVFELVMMTTLITAFNWNKIMFNYLFSSKIINHFDYSHEYWRALVWTI